MSKLTASFVKSLKYRGKPEKLFDGGGLYLHIIECGKYWRYAYRYANRQKTYSIGVYPEISLKQAREIHRSVRDLLTKGIDPMAQKKVEKQMRESAAGDSFEAISREWFETKTKGSSEGHRKRTWRGLEKDLFPWLGSRPISLITPPELLSALRKIEARGALETANRVRQTAGLVFRYAIATGRAERDPSRDLEGALQNPLKKHYAAITDPAEAGRLMANIYAYQGTPEVCSALKLSALLFQRPGEIRRMEWSQIDWCSRMWAIPAERMKSDRPHLVPLANQALEILDELHRLNGRSQYVFPSVRGRSRCLSENGVRTALRNMGYSNEQMTSHGFRAMARTLLDEELHFSPDWIEHQIAHSVKGPLGRAYNRTTHIKGRANMMQAWADYLDELRRQATIQSMDGTMSSQLGPAPYHVVQSIS